MSRNSRRIVLRWICIIGAIPFGFHFLLTGSPIPFWHIEELHQPQLVSAMTEDFITLQDGRNVSLPYIAQIPFDSEVFVAAVKEGVEIDSRGEVFGLLEIRRLCGNDPVIYRKLRLNLTDLAGAISPDGIRSNAIDPHTLSILRDRPVPKLESEMLSAYFLLRMNQVRRSLVLQAGAEEEATLDSSTRNGHQVRTGFLSM